MKKKDKEIKSKQRLNSENSERTEKTKKNQRNNKEIPRIDEHGSPVEGAHQIPKTRQRHTIIEFLNTSYKMILIAFKHEK